MVNDSGQVLEANESVEQRLAKQLREVQKLKHEEFKLFKSAKGNAKSLCSVNQNYVIEANKASLKQKAAINQLQKLHNHAASRITNSSFDAQADLLSKGWDG